MTAATDRRPLVEILTFDGCPNRERAIALVEEVAAELGIDAKLQVVDIPDPETAERLRFLGSPTIRVNGRDVEPGADRRTGFMVACRVYRTEQGFSGQPAERWVRGALASEASAPD